MTGFRSALLLAMAVFHPNIPRTWEDAAVATLEVPLANPKFSPSHISEAEYYQLPERTIYKSYPVYHPDSEPAGYMEWLKGREPEIAFNPAGLKTRADFIAAGEIVFNAPTIYTPLFFSAADLRDRSFYKKAGMPIATDGTVPFATWVIRRKGEVELGSMGCNTCHTRVMPDGSILPGAQGNNPGDREGAYMLRRADPEQARQRVRAFTAQFKMPPLSL